jgi:hypothetical protein
MLRSAYWQLLIDTSWTAYRSHLQGSSSLEINGKTHSFKSHRLTIYETLARPILAYKCEAWTIRKTDETRITAATLLLAVEGFVQNGTTNEMI